MKKLDIRLFRQIKDTRGQFISVTIMVVVALAIFVSMNMVGDNLQESLDTFYQMTNFGDLFSEVVRIPRGAVQNIESVPGIMQAQGRVVSDVLFRTDDPQEKVRVRVVSVPQSDHPISDNYAIEGERIPQRNNEVVIIEPFARAREISIGDTIRPFIAGREHSLTVTGIVANPEYIYLMENEMNMLPDPASFGVIYVTEEMAQNSFGFQGSFNQVVFRIQPGYESRIDQIVEDTEDALSPYGLIRIIKREYQLSNNIMQQELGQLESMSAAITFLFLGVASVIIYIMLGRIVTNDRMSIGVLKAIGYTNAEILSHYVKYALLIGLAGSVFGIFASIPIAGLFTDLYIMFMSIPILTKKISYIYFLYGLLLTLIFCALAGFFGARKVLDIMPADSMKPEAPVSGGRIWLESWSGFWTRLSFSWKMILRNIFRNKKRGLILIFGIALTYGITMVPLYMGTVWNNIFGIQFGVFQTMDYNVDFSRPMNERVLKDLNQMIDAERIEPKIEFPFELQNGWKKSVVNVIAVPGDTQFYYFRTPEGHQIALEPEGIILAESFAKKINVRTGDYIVMKNYLPGKDDLTVRVSGISEQFLGANAFIDIDYFRQLLQEKELVTGAVIGSDDQVREKLQNLTYISKVESNQDMINTFEEFMDLIIYSISTMMLFGAILGFAIVYNVTIININERNLEISSLRVLGFDKKDIFRMISKENSIMTFLGIIFGIPVGRAMCQGIINTVSEELLSIPLLLTPATYIQTAAATLIFVLIAQLATIRKINTIDFMESLKSRTS